MRGEEHAEGKRRKMFISLLGVLMVAAAVAILIFSGPRGAFKRGRSPPPFSIFEIRRPFWMPENGATGAKSRPKERGWS
jgi:hypothetical protein